MPLSTPPCSQPSLDSTVPVCSRIRHRQRRVALAVFVGAGFIYSAIAWRALGAGKDPDAWRLMLSGVELWQTGVYTPSRPPGFPAAELLVAASAPLGLLGFKLMTAWAGAACVALTYLVAARQSSRIALAASMLLLACPAMVLASTTTMDYAWSLAFMLLGLLLAQRSRPATCGLMIGLAAGCRITALAVLPVAWLLLRREGWRPFRCLSALALSTLSVCALLYGWVLVNTPAVLHESTNSFFLPSLDRFSVTPPALWGRIGAVAVALAALVACVRSPQPNRSRPATVSRERRALGIMAGLFLLAYLAAAHEPLYLLPALPPLFILMAGRLGKPATVALAAALAFSNYRDVTSLCITYGTAAQDIRDRDRTARLANWLLHHPPDPPALVIAGSRAPMLKYMAKTEGPTLPEGTRIGYLLRAYMVESERKPGDRLYCLKDMLDACRQRGFDPIAAGAEIWWPRHPANDSADRTRSLAVHTDAATRD